MKKIELPPVNTPVWVVTEHFYYVPSEAAPRREFTVCAGHVLRHNTPRGVSRRPSYAIKIPMVFSACPLYAAAVCGMAAF